MTMTIAQAACSGYIPDVPSEPADGDDDVMIDRYVAEQAEDGNVLDYDEFNEWEDDFREWLEGFRDEAKIDAYIADRDGY